MFRQCLRIRSARPLLRSNLIRFGSCRRTSSSKHKAAQGKASLSGRFRASSIYSSQRLNAFLDRIWPTRRSAIKTTGKVSAALFLFSHIFISYFYTLSPCDGISMIPTLNSYGDWLLISKYYRRGRSVEIGDLVSYHHPVQPETQAVKRVMGMEGDFVLRDTPGTSGKMIQVPQGHCWVVGDNVRYSRDSRHFGPLPLALIRGKVVARWIPWTSLDLIRNPFDEASHNEDAVD